VITSVTRDDLPDGGASHFAKTIQAIRALDREIRIEVLIPDFRGNLSSLVTVADFHNGSLTDRSGLIWDARDLSVDEGAKVNVAITGVSYPSAAQIAVTWTATYDGAAVNPCNAVATAGAPAFHAAAANAATGQVAAGWSLLRAYGEGDDWTNNNIGTKPGQPVS